MKPNRKIEIIKTEKKSNQFNTKSRSNPCNVLRAHQTPL